MSIVAGHDPRLTSVMLMPLIRWLLTIVESFDAALIDMNGEHDVGVGHPEFLDQRR